MTEGKYGCGWKSMHSKNRALITAFTDGALCLDCVGCRGVYICEKSITQRFKKSANNFLQPSYLSVFKLIQGVSSKQFKTDVYSLYNYLRTETNQHIMFAA